MLEQNEFLGMLIGCLAVIAPLCIAIITPLTKNTNQITAESKGYYYSWMGVGNDETHAVPYEIYGMKL